MTNAIPVITQAAKAAPLIIINWTMIISVCAVCLTAMTAAINIFKNKKIIDDDELRDSSLVKDLTETIKDHTKKNEDVKETISTLRTEIEKIKVEMLNTNKSLEELKQDNRELVQRLDELLRQLLELLGA